MGSRLKIILRHIYQYSPINNFLNRIKIGRKSRAISRNFPQSFRAKRAGYLEFYDSRAILSRIKRFGRTLKIKRKQA